MGTRARPVPAATKPAADRRRAGRDWKVKVCDLFVEGASGMGKTKVHGTPLHRGMVVATWLGTRGVLNCSDETWQEIETNGVWADEITDMQQEAKRTMPKAVMRDVSVSAATRGQVVVQPGHPVPTAQVGITALKAELVRLVQDMAAYDHPTVAVQVEFARRYGRYRDAMARLRREFLEAEGAFETAQAMLVGFMED